MAAHFKTPEDTIDFLLQVIKSCDNFKADYTIVARDCGINTAQNAQRKLKSVAEAAGFALVNGAITMPNGAVAPAPAAKATGIKAQVGKAKAKANSGGAKKRKLNADEDANVAGDGDGEGKEVKAEVDNGGEDGDD